MALIKCSECGKEISDRAEACPGCGDIVTNQQITHLYTEGVPTHEQTVLIEHTSKDLKTKYIKGWALVFFGSIGVICAIGIITEYGGIIQNLAIIVFCIMLLTTGVGIIKLLSTHILRWWNHG